MTSEKPEGRVYLDHLMAPPCLPEAASAAAEALDRYPGSLRSGGVCGREAASFVDGMAAEMAGMFGAAGVQFTSGGGDANIRAVLTAGRSMLARGKNHLISTGQEHSSVIAALRRLQAEGCSVDWLPAGSDGRIDPSRLEELIGPSTGLVTVRHGNPVTGILQPVMEIADMVSGNGARLHVDWCASTGRVGLDLGGSGIDTASISGRSAGGGPGAGALLTREEPGDEVLLCSWHTLPPNTAAIAGMMAALSPTVRRGTGAMARMADDLREAALSGLRDAGVRFEAVGGDVPRLPGACLLKLPDDVPVTFHASVERSGVILPCPLSSERLAALRQMGQDTSNPGRFLGFCFPPAGTILDVEFFVKAVTEGLE
jgi:cysteine sulfinate desulfinase/cysteine desulfurase-like protein